MSNISDVIYIDFFVTGSVFDTSCEGPQIWFRSYMVKSRNMNKKIRWHNTTVDDCYYNTTLETLRPMNHVGVDHLLIDSLGPYTYSVNTVSSYFARAMASQITRVSIVCSTICSGADQIKHSSSASLAFVRGVHQSRVDSPQQRACNAQNVFIWWRLHDKIYFP